MPFGPGAPTRNRGDHRLTWLVTHSSPELTLTALPCMPSLQHSCTETRRGATRATQPASASLHLLHRLTVVTAVVPYARFTHSAMHACVEAEAKPHVSKD